jgi:tryptophanyl-tRNA synthetase
MPALATTASLQSRPQRSSAPEPAIERDPGSFRILTGDRPTGALHIGHYFGSLHNRVRLQQAGAELLVLIADYQAVTDRTAAADLPRTVLGLVADYLAVGIDPSRAVIFAHSQVPALNQLMLPFLSLVSISELRRNPTVKDEIAAGGPTAMTGLMFTYPVHQAADILSCHANLVPVGKDQLPHLELTRVIARRFNERYSPDLPYFAEPSALLGTAPLLRGLDGRKMGKSAGNSIPIRIGADETARLVSKAKTDSERVISYQPGRRPEVANLLLIAALCRDETPEAIAAEVGAGGATALKAVVTDAVNARFAPIRACRAELAADPAYLSAVLAAGNERASAMAGTTLQEVLGLMHNKY